ncbi:hypothetical protein WOLCODRAFT_140700 [Wolfiporia cocos MD-104 SS10]|uniref:Autophagy-related protein 13 n=1 Tax=Wolfiporia cocos (strain MD-104) TaxID=742152 RepID=A0A2H3JM46_WOLCO|nr:hypothetical protein WOLCODRAFT_140700 [Wolfiporia cocos MD-104 SS10]
MSNDIQKADQIAYRLHTKLVLVVYDGRSTEELPAEAKVDKWFNLETLDPDIFKENARIYRSLSSVHTVPEFKLHVLLCIPELANNQVLVYHSPDSSRIRIDPTPEFILLESWNIVFAPYHAQPRNVPDVTPAAIYKHGITMFRSIFTLLRLLPAWKLARRLRRRSAGGRNANFSIKLRVQTNDENCNSGQILGFNAGPAHGEQPFEKGVHTFPAIAHPEGTLTFSITYLTTPNFRVDALESLLSSRFRSLDEEPDFTPTLVKNQQRNSVSGSPASQTLRTSVQRSPPSSIADRFVVPPPVSSRTPSSSPVSGSPRMQTAEVPPSRPFTVTGLTTGISASGVSDSSSPRQGVGSVASRDEPPAVSALAARLKRASTEAGRGTESLTTPVPLPIRRSPIPPVNPFKSSTLSSGSPSMHSASPSLRQHSPLASLPGGVGPSLPSRPAHASPSSSRGGMSIAPSSSRVPSSPVTPFRPSPPFAPSSLDRRSLGSAEGHSIGHPESPRASGKRYSSSFGHRYSLPGAVSSEGCVGSGAKEGERATGASFLSTNTEDDDISAFVQDIDERKPLGASREPSSSSGEASRVDGAGPSPASVSLQGHPRTRTMSMPAPMLATESEVDEQLRHMRERFDSTVQGIRRRNRENGSNAERPSTPASAPGEEQGRAEIPAANAEAEVNLGGIRLPADYVRPRLGSTASVRSGFSIASAEVLGRMDPEVNDGRSRDPNH